MVCPVWLLCAVCVVSHEVVNKLQTKEVLKSCFSTLMPLLFLRAGDATKGRRIALQSVQRKLNMV